MKVMVRKLVIEASNSLYVHSDQCKKAVCVMPGQDAINVPLKMEGEESQISEALTGTANL